MSYFKKTAQEMKSWSIANATREQVESEDILRWALQPEEPFVAVLPLEDDKREPSLLVLYSLFRGCLP